MREAGHSKLVLWDIQQNHRLELYWVGIIHITILGPTAIAKGIDWSD